MSQPCDILIINLLVFSSQYLLLSSRFIRGSFSYYAQFCDVETGRLEGEYRTNSGFPVLAKPDVSKD